MNFFHILKNKLLYLPCFFKCNFRNGRPEKFVYKRCTEYNRADCLTVFGHNRRCGKRQTYCNACLGQKRITEIFFDFFVALAYCRTRICAQNLSDNAEHNVYNTHNAESRQNRKFKRRADATKNSINIGGVTASTTFITGSDCLEKLTNTAPSAIQRRSDEMPSTSAIPIPANTKPTASESLFPSFLKKRTKYVKSIPKTAPIPSAPIISTIGEKIILTTDTFAVELSIPATATAIPKSISATASSRATTDKSVSVTGPFALYWADNHNGCRGCCCRRD